MLLYPSIFSFFHPSFRLVILSSMLPFYPSIPSFYLPFTLPSFLSFISSFFLSTTLSFIPSSFFILPSLLSSIHSLSHPFTFLLPFYPSIFSFIHPFILPFSFHSSIFLNLAILPFLHPSFLLCYHPYFFPQCFILPFFLSSLATPAFILRSLPIWVWKSVHFVFHKCVGTLSGWKGHSLFCNGHLGKRRGSWFTSDPKQISDLLKWLTRIPLHPKLLSGPSKSYEKAAVTVSTSNNNFHLDVETANITWNNSLLGEKPLMRFPGRRSNL